jgi:hypothetical protein
MAHFARIDISNHVIQVIVADRDFINSLPDAVFWIQTSYNTYAGIHYDPNTGEPSQDQSKALRKNFAAIGYLYDSGRDAFIPPKPFASWSLDEFSCLWVPPVPYPDDGLSYEWNEESLSWVEITS